MGVIVAILVGWWRYLGTRQEARKAKKEGARAPEPRKRPPQRDTGWPEPPRGPAAGAARPWLLRSPAEDPPTNPHGWPAAPRSTGSGPVDLPRAMNRLGIFISYRRQDEPNFAGRLYDRLVTQFGRSNVFIDVDTIELGLDFAEVIDESLSQCKVMIVIIGKQWLQVADENGDLRINNPDDYVRLEIEKALNSQTRVIPILVEGASVPKSSQLPESLAALARRNGIAMSHASFGSDAERLIETLHRILGTNMRPSS